MNINLVYQNKSFNFDLRKDISIKYLEDLASKLINKDISSFELLYKDNILSDDKNSLLKNIIQGETASIIISPKFQENKKKAVKKLPKLKIINNLNNTNTTSIKNNILLNETEISQSFSENSIKAIQNLSKINSKVKSNKIKKSEGTTENKVFEEIYNAKDNELISLMNDLSQKIKEYDDALYKKYKNNFNKASNNLIIFEKNIIDFKDKQIKFFKKLIYCLDSNKDNDFTRGLNALDEFYKELDEYNNKKKIVEYENKIEKLEKQLLAPANLNEKISVSNKELPMIINKNINPTKNKLLLSEKKTANSLNLNNIERQEKDEKSQFFYLNKNNKLKSIPIRNKQDNIYQSIITDKKQESKTIDVNANKNHIDYLKNSLGNTTKANTNQSENSISSKTKDKLNNLSLKDKKTNNSPTKFFTKKQNIKKNKEENNNQGNNNRSSLYKRVNTIQNINYNKNKVSTLFEISESYAKENKDSEINDNSSNCESSIEKERSQESKDKIKKENIYENETIKELKANLKKKNSINYSLIKNSKIGYLVKAKNNRAINRIKKLGNNPNDFII